MGVFKLSSLKKKISENVSLGSNTKEVNLAELATQLLFVKNGRIAKIPINVSQFRLMRKTASVCLDLDWVVAECRTRNRGVNMQMLLNRFIRPFIRNKIFVIAVCGGEEPKRFEDVKTLKQYHKLVKNVKKAFWNLDQKERERKLDEFEKSRTYAFPMEECDTDFDEKLSVRKILNSVEYYHWKNHSERRRIDASMVRRAADWLSSVGVPVVFAPEEADEWCAMLYHAGLADYIVSGDTDMLAMKCDIIDDIIPGQNGTTDRVRICRYSDILEFFDGIYTEDQIQDGMALASADFNSFLYDQSLGFLKAVRIVKNVGFHRYLEMRCKQLGRDDSWTMEMAEAVRTCYQLPNPSDLSDTRMTEMYQSLMLALCNAMQDVRMSSLRQMLAMPDCKTMLNELSWLRTKLQMNLRTLIGIATVKVMCEYVFQIWTSPHLFQNVVLSPKTVPSRKVFKKQKLIDLR